jgi:hypothetical protein
MYNQSRFKNWVPDNYLGNDDIWHLLQSVGRWSLGVGRWRSTKELAGPYSEQLTINSQPSMFSPTSALPISPTASRSERIALVRRRGHPLRKSVHWNQLECVH